MKHGLHPEARAELFEAVRYYKAIDSQLGIRFYHEVERSIRDLCARPQQFYRLYPPARRSLLRTFPYAVVFLELPDRILIVAVMHTKRRPGYWLHRIE